MFCSLIYYTADGTHAIKRVGMDGSNPVTLVATDLGDARGITTDFKSSRLCWADGSRNKIESSDLQGRDRRTVVKADGPTGIAVVDGRVYWGEWSGKKLQSSITAAGEEIITLHTEGKSIYAVTLVPDLNRPLDRINHCVRNSCSKVCVLTATSFRCLD